MVEIVDLFCKVGHSSYRSRVIDQRFDLGKAQSFSHRFKKEREWETQSCMFHIILD